MWNRTFLLTHLGFLLTLWWNAWRSLSAPSNPAGAVAGLSIQPVLPGASSGSVYEGAHLALSRCVCSGSAGKPRLLTGSQTPPSSTCCSTEMFALGSPPAAGQPCPALPRDAGCPQRLPARRDVLVIAPSFEAPWHLQTQHCFLKNREEEKWGGLGRKR